jgi:hypothetical protein
MAKKITAETALKRAIKDYMRLSGWDIFHNLNYGIGVYRGIADLTALKCINDLPITLWIEAKSKKGVQSDDQIKFEKMIKKNKGHYIVVRSIYDIENYLVKNFGEKNLLL